MVNHSREYLDLQLQLRGESNDPELVEGPLQAWYVYIAQAKTNRYYVGITTDVHARIHKHNSGKGSRFAVNQGPFKLVYVSSPYVTKSEARTREIQIKGWSRTKKEKLIAGVWQ